MLPATRAVAPVRGSHASSDASSSVESCHCPAPCTRSGPSPSAVETIVPSRPNASPRASRAIEPLAIGQVPASIHGEPSKSVTRSVPDGARLLVERQQVADERDVRGLRERDRGAEPAEVAAGGGREAIGALVGQAPVPVQCRPQAERLPRAQPEVALDVARRVVDHEVREVDAPARHGERGAQRGDLDALAVEQREADVAEPDVGRRHLEESRQEMRRARRPRLAALEHDLDRARPRAGRSARCRSAARACAPAAAGRTPRCAPPRAR